MSDLIVLDASVAVDVMLGRVDSTEIDDLVSATVWAPPDLFRLEVASALTRLVRAGRLPAGEVADLIRGAARLPTEEAELTQEHLDRAIALASASLTYTDALYVVTAQAVGGVLYTTDKRAGRTTADGNLCPVHVPKLATM